MREKSQCIKQKTEFLALTLEQKEQCVTWYDQTQYLTSARRFLNPEPENSSCAKLYTKMGGEILVRSENFENRSESGGPSTTNGSTQAARSYFRTDPRRSVRRAESVWALLDLQLTDYLKMIHMFPYNVT